MAVGETGVGPVGIDDDDPEKKKKEKKASVSIQKAYR